MALALTGCKDGNAAAQAEAKGSPATGGETAKAPAKGGGGPSASADGQGVTPNFPPVWVDATGLYSALPSDGSVGDVMVGGEPFVIQGGEAATYCEKQTASPCPGLQAVGHRDMEARGNADSTRVEFTLLTFPTAEEADQAMKNLADQRRKEWAEEGAPAKPVTLNTDADATDAMQDGDSVDVIMRVGAVVAYLDAYGASRNNVEYAGKVQIARVKSVSNGINPDR
jgi:hypothetical protein